MTPARFFAWLRKVRDRPCREDQAEIRDAIEGRPGRPANPVRNPRGDAPCSSTSPPSTTA